MVIALLMRWQVQHSDEERIKAVFIEVTKEWVDVEGLKEIFDKYREVGPCILNVVKSVFPENTIELSTVPQ